MSKKIIILLSLIILFLFLIPDLVYWAVLDNFKTPMRYISGDTGLYVSQLNNLLNTGRPAGNPYFIENHYEVGRFFAFGKLFALLPFTDKVSTIWWTIILRGAVPFFIFFVMANFFRLFYLERRSSYWFSFIFTFLFGTITFKGGTGMVNWYLPMFILGLTWVIEFYQNNNRNPLGLFFVLISPLFFSLHPIYFFTGIGLSGVFWLLILNKNRTWKMAGFFTGWGIITAVLFYFVFLPFFYSADPVLAKAARDMSLRNTMLFTHFPFLFLYSVRYLLLMVISLLGLKSVINKNYETKWRQIWSAVAMFSAIAFLGLNSYVITGRYFINDHFPLLEDFIVIPLFILILFGPQIKFSFFSKWLGWIVLLVSFVSMLVIWNYLSFKPVYFGRWVPQYAAYFSMGLLFIWPTLKEKLFVNYGKIIAAFFVFMSVFYFVFMAFWDEKYWFSFHKEIQRFRPLIEELNKLPTGVILSNYYIADLITTNTPHKLYWSAVAMHDLVSTDELTQRWTEARAFFPKEPAFNDNGAVFSVYGTKDNKCREFKRGFYLGYLSRLGINGPQKKICDKSLNDKWPEMRAQADNYYKKVILGSIWKPSYRIDYLVMEKNKDFIPPMALSRYFKKIADTETATVFAFIGQK